MVVAGFYVVYGFPLSSYTFSKVCSKYKDEVYALQKKAVKKKYRDKQISQVKNNLPISQSDDEEDMNEELVNLGFGEHLGADKADSLDVLNYEDKLDDDRFKIIRGSHYPRWTDYRECGEVFFGLSQQYSMDPAGKEYPFKDFTKEEKRELNEYCQSVFGNEEVEIQYHIYPDDCNCCS